MRPSLSFSCFLLIVALVQFIAFSSSSEQPSVLCHSDERRALMQFKESFIIDKHACSATSSSYPKVDSWDSQGVDCCSWDGVECDQMTGVVIGLDLSSGCLYGSINSSNSLFRLLHLQKLNLAFNDFNHSLIPSALGNLSMLTYLNLSSSVFSGQIPSEISKLYRLSSLDLSNNQEFNPFRRGVVNQVVYSDIQYTSLYSSGYPFFQHGIIRQTVLTLVFVPCILLFLRCRRLPFPAPLKMEGRRRCTLKADRVCDYNCSSCNSVECFSNCSLSSNSDAANGSKNERLHNCRCKAKVSKSMKANEVASCRKENIKIRSDFDELKIRRARMFNYEELERATGGFKEESVVGKGSFSCVYKGVLKDGTVVAVIKAIMSSDKQKNSKEFHTELDLLSRLNHAHLLNLLGYCEEGGERLLIYEFMAHGSLHQHLHGKNKA
ncbi:hypothetical protein F3Y22_tig00003435pilonHSYRG00024 [Hibiscus syriacus]|uniref:non-specific serine/threonine protein kinase n=1 Tax=Hibiscus syriacus TaxID=106335 RepID=A0A6A3CJW9_HIBSY|nr:hypothetical protein F3Y22_tig00003435pilonHSYRG00024 [Hibiscus syriacus]